MNNEEWLPVKDFPDYEISNKGRVKSNKRATPRILKQQLSPQGRLKVELSSPKTTKYVHVLVAETFIGERPDGLLCLHKDGDPTNNAVDNLYWGTYADNACDAVNQGTHVSCRRRKLSAEQIERIRSGESPTLLAREFRVDRSTIYQVINKETYTNSLK